MKTQRRKKKKKNKRKKKNAQVETHVLYLWTGAQPKKRAPLRSRESLPVLPFGWVYLLGSFLCCRSVTPACCHSAENTEYRGLNGASSRHLWVVSSELRRWGCLPLVCEQRRPATPAPAPRQALTSKRVGRGFLANAPAQVSVDITATATSVPLRLPCIACGKERSDTREERLVAPAATAATVAAVAAVAVPSLAKLELRD